MDEVTIKTYNELAKEYDDETTDFWDRFPSTIIDRFVGAVRGKVLDVGSGPGRDAMILKGRGLSVTCLDASSAMVELSRARGLESVVGDFAALPFPEGVFDGVWAYTSLLHIPKNDVGQPLAEIKRVLREGGFLALGLVEGETEGYKESSDMHKPRWFSYYTKEEVEDILKRYGFEQVYFEEFKPKSKRYLNFIVKNQKYGGG